MQERMSGVASERERLHVAQAAALVSIGALERRVLELEASRGRARSQLAELKAQHNALQIEHTAVKKGMASLQAR
jgi:chromosome segregation ATPase